jgi:hypothetical protein
LYDDCVNPGPVCAYYFLSFVALSILDGSFTAAKWPTAPQEFDLSGQRNWHPQMPDPQPYFGDTGKRRALIVRDRQTMYYTLIFIIGVQDWDQLFSASGTWL